MLNTNNKKFLTGNKALLSGLAGGAFCTCFIYLPIYLTLFFIATNQNNSFGDSQEPYQSFFNSNAVLLPTSFITGVLMGLAALTTVAIAHKCRESKTIFNSSGSNYGSTSDTATNHIQKL